MRGQHELMSSQGRPTDDYHAPPGSEEEYLPKFDGCGLVPATDFRKHPLSRDNPWARAHPDSVHRRIKFELEDPYHELEQRGAIFDGEVVTVHEAKPSAEGQQPPNFEGNAVIQSSPFQDPQLVSIDDLEPIPRYHNAGSRFASGIPSYYEREIGEKEQIADTCPIDVYCSSVNPRWGWRWKIISYYEAPRPAIRASCDTLIVDSGFNRWGSPNDVLEAAAAMDADFVFATDVTGMEDPTNNGHNHSMPSTEEDEIETQLDAAIQGIEQFMHRARELDILNRVILPVQHPYLDCLERMEARGWISEVDYIALGGLLQIDDVNQRLKAMKQVRDVVGEDIRIHALAPGTEPELLRELRANPSLIDSLDNSTPEKSVASNKVPDTSWNQNEHLFPYGDQVTTVRAQFSGAIATQLAYMLSSLCDDRTFEEIIEEGSNEAEGEAIRSLDEWASA